MDCILIKKKENYDNICVLISLSIIRDYVHILYILRRNNFTLNIHKKLLIMFLKQI